MLFTWTAKMDMDILIYLINKKVQLFKIDYKNITDSSVGK